MEFKICPVCGSFMSADSSNDVCEFCTDRDIREYSKVKDYLVRHQGASMAEVHNYTNIPLKTIRRFIQDKRIELVR